MHIARRGKSHTHDIYQKSKLTTTATPSSRRGLEFKYLEAEGPCVLLLPSYNDSIASIEIQSVTLNLRVFP